MSNPYIKYLIAVIVGILVASSVGISPALYVGAVALTIVVGVVAGVVPYALLLVRDVAPERILLLATTIVAAVSLAVDAQLGFSLHQIVVIAALQVVFQVALELLFPTR